MIIAAFEAIMHDAIKMQMFKSDPIRHATFLALYDYVKAGNKLTYLPWFSGLVNLHKIENKESGQYFKKAA